MARTIGRRKIGDKEVMPFTIPSGIITTEFQTLERIANEVDGIGILTTKSIGPEPRKGNREPILLQYMPGGFMNAVGLTNYGVEESAKRLSQITIPREKFLLANVFGKTPEEFSYVVRSLEGAVGEQIDGFELNLSCPHAEKVGMAIGTDPVMVRDVTRHVIFVTDKPVFVKLTPNVPNIGQIAEAAVEGGAYGITAINTVGPGYYTIDGHPTLTNVVGGISGRGILPIGLKCVRDIRQAVGKDIPIIGMGGISTAKDVRTYDEAGADFFGIGSALVEMDDNDLRKYFSVLVKDLREGTNNAEKLLKEVDMSYRKIKVSDKITSACDLKVLVTDTSIEAEPGQFVFAWIPGVGEKPFSVMDDAPLTLGILGRGEFTRAINSLEPGDSFYYRGPYGKGVDIPNNVYVTLVGGGCGIAGLYLPAKKLSENHQIFTFLGAKDREHLLYLEQFKRFGSVHVATEDGSLGTRGLITDLFEGREFPPETYFLNCGPREMLEAVLPLELKITSSERIYSSVDYMTKCGVGLCGSCADERGRRTCVEGPFMKA